MKKTLFILCSILLLFGCDEETPIPGPTSANLIFPYENSLCNEGLSITSNESSVLFEWESGNNTDNYELRIENLTTGNISTHQTSNTEISVSLKRATSFAWYVVSKSNSVSETAQSVTWKFYNAGEGVESYAPFPAEIISPAMAETITTAPSEITLDWNGSDVDGDITGYDVYFGTTTTPGIIENDLRESILINVPVSSNTIYFWKIITIDARGNKSDSGVYQFKIQ